MDNSLDSTFYDTVTTLQKVEALENAAAILEKWTDLAPLAEPLHKAQRALLASGIQQIHEVHDAS